MHRALMAYSWVLGITAALLACFLGALGQTFQRLSRIEAEQEPVLVAPYWRRKWILGTFLYMLAAIFDAASYVCVPIAVIVVIYALRLPIVSIFAFLMLSVHISPKCMLGIFLCAFGSALSLVCAPVASKTILSTPLDLFTIPISSYLCASAISCTSLAIAVRTASNRVTYMALPLLAAWIMNIEKLFNSAIGRLAPGVSMFSLQWVWLPALVVVLMIVGGVLNLSGVEQQSTHTFVPSVFAFQAVILGAESILFGEFHHVGIALGACWAAGLLVTVAGTAAIAASNVDHKVFENIDEGN